MKDGDPSWLEIVTNRVLILHRPNCQRQDIVQRWKQPEEIKVLRPKDHRGEIWCSLPEKHLLDIREELEVVFEAVGDTKLQIFQVRNGLDVLQKR